MLFDPKWKQPTTADPLELDTLIAWLEKQPEDEVFCWKFPVACPLTQYFKETGCADYRAKSEFLGNYYTTFGRVIGIGADWPFSTYGAALKRARAIAAQQS